MSIITLGGLSGAGSRDIGPKLAQQLGSDYVDRFILTTVARRLGSTVEALHQREERPPSKGERLTRLFQRILDRSAVTGTGGDPYFGPGIAAFFTEEYEDLPQTTITRGHELEDELYFEGISSVINDAATSGNVVFAGRGSYVILKDRPDVLRVGIEARIEDRIKTIMGRENLTEIQATKIIKERDEARLYYFNRFFNIENPDDPSLFHFVINTSDIKNETATDMILQAYKAMEEGRLR